MTEPFDVKNYLQAKALLEHGYIVMMGIPRMAFLIIGMPDGVYVATTCNPNTQQAKAGEMDEETLETAYNKTVKNNGFVMASKDDESMAILKELKDENAAWESGGRNADTDGPGATTDNEDAEQGP